MPARDRTAVGGSLNDLCLSSPLVGEGDLGCFACFDCDGLGGCWIVDPILVRTSRFRHGVGTGFQIQGDHAGGIGNIGSNNLTARVLYREMPAGFTAAVGRFFDNLALTKAKIIPETYRCRLPGLDGHLLGIGAAALIHGIDCRIRMTDFLDPNRANIQSGHSDRAITAGSVRAGNHGRTGCIGVDFKLPSGKILSVLGGLYDFYIALGHRQSKVTGNRICFHIHGHHGLGGVVFGIPHDHRIWANGNFVTSGMNDTATSQLRYGRRSCFDDQGVTGLLEGQSLHRTLVIEILQNAIGVCHAGCVQAAGCVILKGNGVGICQLCPGPCREAGNLSVVLQAYQ